MKKKSKKTKSDFIFWIILIAFLAFIFFTPYGQRVRSWLTALTLSSPQISLDTNINIKVNDDWKLISTEGIEVSLNALKKPVFINIWATWCPPCRSELPSILALKKTYNNKIDFLLISPSESLEKLSEFAKKNNYSSTFYTSNGPTPEQLFSSSYPTTYILDTNKNLILKSVGAHDWNAKNVHEMLDKLIKE